MPSRGPYRSSTPASSPGQGKCPLIQHTRSDDEERPICLNCPYPHCLLDSPCLWTHDQPPPVASRRPGRPPDPFVAARNTTILQLLDQGRTPAALALRFNLSRSSIYKIRRRYGSTAP